LREHHPEAVRLYFASSHYRSQMDFDEENIKKAGQTVESLRNILDRIRALAKTASNEVESNRELISALERRRSEFHSAMEDDFNTPVAISSLLAFSREMDKMADERKLLEEKDRVTREKERPPRKPDDREDGKDKTVTEAPPQCGDAPQLRDQPRAGSVVLVRGSHRNPQPWGTLRPRHAWSVTLGSQKRVPPAMKTATRAAIVFTSLNTGEFRR
jgi:hypothetical protein